MLHDLAQHPDVLHRAGIASAVLSIYAFWPYIRDILNNRTRPERASWLIWSLLSAVSLLAQIYEGADGSLGFAAMQTAGTLIVCGLTFWKTTKLHFEQQDSQVLTATAVGIWLWGAMESAAYSLFVTISMSMMGGLLTMKKAFLDPKSETCTTWAAFFVSAGLALVAIGRIDWLLMAYPLYVMVLSGGIMLSMAAGHLHEKRRASAVPTEKHRQLTLSIMSFQRAGSPSVSD